jgi:hypothetical protein
MEWAWHIAGYEENKRAYKRLIGKPKGQTHLKIQAWI